jgi:hypothetical protein
LAFAKRRLNAWCIAVIPQGCPICLISPNMGRTRGQDVTCQVLTINPQMK